MKRILFVVSSLVCLAGCSQLNNPFHDPYVNCPPVTTPSVEAVMAADVQPTTQERHGGPKLVSSVDGCVEHGPLFFEDPTEERGSEDGQFAVTGEDFLWIAYWRARFMANLIAYPVSAVVNPPWQKMVSDGRHSGCGRGREFDAEPSADGD